MLLVRYVMSISLFYPKRFSFAYLGCKSLFKDYLPTIKDLSTMGDKDDRALYNLSYLGTLQPCLSFNTIALLWTDEIMFSMVYIMLSLFVFASIYFSTALNVSRCHSPGLQCLPLEIKNSGSHLIQALNAHNIKSQTP